MTEAVKKKAGRPIATKQVTDNKKSLKDKSYRLSNDESPESYLLTVGRNRKLLIFDKEVGYNRAIRHCPNEKSIFIDEQSEHALVQPIILTKGYIDVSYKDQATQKFLDNHPFNVANGGSLFEEIDDEKTAIESTEVEELILDIKQLIRDTAKQPDGIYALEMAVAVLKDSVDIATKMGKEELKRVLYQEADRKPDYFTDDSGNINIFDDDFMQRKYLSLRAIKDGIIKKSPNNKSIVWVSDNKVIVTAPASVDLMTYFAEYLATDDGILVIEEIKKRS